MRLHISAVLFCPRNPWTTASRSRPSWQSGWWYILVWLSDYFWKTWPHNPDFKLKFYLEANHPHDCKTEASGEASCWKSKKETATFPFNGTRVGNVPNFLFWSPKPHEIDTGDEVKCKEAKVDRGVEREDEAHHHKAESCGNQLIEKREPLEWVEEESDLKKCLLTFCIFITWSLQTIFHTWFRRTMVRMEWNTVQIFIHFSRVNKSNRGWIRYFDLPA